MSPVYLPSLALNLFYCLLYRVFLCIGTDLMDLHINGRPVSCREVGSAMSSSWGKYLFTSWCIMVRQPLLTISCHVACPPCIRHAMAVEVAVCVCSTDHTRGVSCSTGICFDDVFIMCTYLMTTICPFYMIYHMH